MNSNNNNQTSFQSLMKSFKLFFSVEFFKKPIVFWPLILSLAVNLAIWLAIRMFIKETVDLNIILHYNVYFGVDLVGPWREVYMFPIIGLVLYFINLLLAIYFYALGERMASYLLVMAILMIELCLAIASLGVIMINY